jgi:O-antigen/teichoic acid export membrane protein
VTALLAMRLIGRYYDLGMLARAPLDRAVARDLLSSGLGILPSNAAQRFFIDLPPLVLNAIIPGNAGAIAAGLFGIARKIATVPQLVRQVFLYVLAPLASAQAAADRSGIAPLYAFATRLSTIAVIPLAAFICLIGEEILRLFSPAAATALPILVVLVVGRGVEAVVGPASPVVEMIGHKLLPTLNSLAGLALWAGIAAWRVPIDGAVGMGWAVAAGVVLRSWLAVAELRISDGFRPFRGRFVLCLSLGALGAAALSLVDTLMSGGNTWLEVAVLAVFLCATIWTGLRFGLTRSDREALGIVGVKLGLFPALPAS